MEDARLRPVLNRIEDLHRAGLNSLMVVANFLCRRLDPQRECARPAWMYIEPCDVTRTCVGEDGDLDEGALAAMLKVVTGVEDLARAGPIDRTGRRDPGTLHIPGADDNGGRGAAADDGRPPSWVDKGKRPRVFIPQPSSSSSSPSPLQSPRREPRPTAGGATAGGRTGQPSGAGSGADAGTSSQRLRGQSPSPKRRRPEPRPNTPEFQILQSRWRYHGPKSTPPKDSVGGRTSPEQPRPPPVPESRAPTSFVPSPLTGEEQPASGEVVTMRVALAWPPSGSPSASAERARRGPSSRPSPGQAPEPLPEVLGSAREVIRRLEAAIAAERAKLEEERAALELAVEREALEEVREEAVTAQEEADCLGRLAAEREQASRKRTGELATREERLALREQEVASREEAVGKGEEMLRSAQADLRYQANDLECGRTDVLRPEEQVTLRETDTDLASSALAAQEENVTNEEAGLTAREQAIEARAKRLEQARIEVAAQI
ncbi:uncharacterized protein LOC133902903 [Phragmites australis]|uniref:uncharacterized protein LOC133902903 n=1 Tax=Phragmites australis TaxID=29695 RepID=UPI002D77BF55|nr:uncharacterized protein LOC133902903 [Phragmites australis]